MISQREVRRIFDYSPVSGEFRWRVRSQSSPFRVGDIAGHVNAGGHRQIGIGHNKFYYAHCLAWLYVYGVLPAQLDHKDGNGDNNAIDNLRECSSQENCRNRRVSSLNKSGFKGVYASKGKWRSVISVDRRHIHLGYFYSPVEAAEAYNAAAGRLFGEFARINAL